MEEAWPWCSGQDLYKVQESEPSWVRAEVGGDTLARTEDIGAGDTCVVRHGGLVCVALFLQDNVAKLEDS